MRVLVLTFALVLQGCLNTRPWRRQERPWTPETVQHAEDVRVTRKDWTMVLFEEFVVVVGEGGGYIEGPPGKGREPNAPSIRVGFDEIEVFETRRQEDARVVVNIVTVWVILGFVWVAALSVSGSGALLFY